MHCFFSKLLKFKQLQASLHSNKGCNHTLKLLFTLTRFSILQGCHQVRITLCYSTDFWLVKYFQVKLNINQSHISKILLLLNLVSFLLPVLVHKQVVIWKNFKMLIRGLIQQKKRTKIKQIAKITINSVFIRKVEIFRKILNVRLSV